MGNLMSRDSKVQEKGSQSGGAIIEKTKVRSSVVVER